MSSAAPASSSSSSGGAAAVLAAGVTSLLRKLGFTPSPAWLAGQLRGREHASALAAPAADASARASAASVMMSVLYEDLRDCGAPTELVDDDGATALHWASEEGRADCVRALLTAGANKGARTTVGLSSQSS